MTPANVNANSFGKLFSVAVDGYMYAQPLYVPGLTMRMARCTMCCFLRRSTTRFMLSTRIRTAARMRIPSGRSPCWMQRTERDRARLQCRTETPASPDIAPEIGITGTPVINPATNTMYVVGATKENGAYFLRLHALNILTGAEQAHSPVAIDGTVTGTGNGSSGGKLTFSPLWAKPTRRAELLQRLCLYRLRLAWRQWAVAWLALRIQRDDAGADRGLVSSPNGFGSGVWEAGAGMPIDDDATGGRMFVATGNGTFTTYPPFNANTELAKASSTSILRMAASRRPTRLRRSTRRSLQLADCDLGSGGILMLPDQQGANPHILMQAGKEGRIVVLNRDQLGGYATGVTSNTNALQDIPGATGGCGARRLTGMATSTFGARPDDVPQDCSRSTAVYWTPRLRANRRSLRRFPAPPFPCPPMARRMALPGRCGRTSSPRMGRVCCMRGTRTTLRIHL